MAASKLQRWMDLLAGLLARHYAVAFEDLKRDVPAYREGSEGAVRKMFERDKDDLRQFGVPIETVKENGDVKGYRLRSRDFYLPYITLVDQEHRSRPNRVNRDGYHGLQELAFTSDQLSAIADGARLVLALGDEHLSSAVRMALRKLAVDLPMDGTGTAPDTVTLVPQEPRPDEQVLEALAGALERRKRVSFDYQSVATGAIKKRTVEPLGLFFLTHHWYLAARETGQSVVKNFRVSRMAGVVANTKSPASPDFERPAGFDLREHARHRHAWELGDGTGMEAVIAFRRGSGAADAAARLGAAVPGEPDQRRYDVRRLDSFVRWLLPLAGYARPVAPAELVDAWRTATRETLALYGGAA